MDLKAYGGDNYVDDVNDDVDEKRFLERRGLRPAAKN